MSGSVEKLSWLPEAHTDFLMAVLGEEFGLLAVVLRIDYENRQLMRGGRT